MVIPASMGLSWIVGSPESSNVAGLGAPTWKLTGVSGAMSHWRFRMFPCQDQTEILRSLIKEMSAPSTKQPPDVAWIRVEGYLFTMPLTWKTSVDERKTGPATSCDSWESSCRGRSCLAYNGLTNTALQNVPCNIFLSFRSVIFPFANRGDRLNIS